jgi:hypothetical protein
MDQTYYSIGNDIYYIQDDDDWRPDAIGSNCKQTTSDECGKVFMWDAPGQKFGSDPWAKTFPHQDTTNLTWTGWTSYKEYLDMAKYNGRWCSDYFFWGRVLRLHSIVLFPDWYDPPDEND